MNQKVKFIIIVAVQVIFLLGMIASKQFIKDNGEKILLKTEPIDPQSLFSGDYVMLNYNISTLDETNVAIQEQFRRGQTAYLSLRKGEKYAEPVALASTKPTGLFLRGKVQDIQTSMLFRFAYAVNETLYESDYLDWFHEGAEPYQDTDVYYVHIDIKDPARILWIERYNQQQAEEIGPMPVEKTGYDQRVPASLLERKEDMTQLRVSYGIESYYIPEGEGKIIENNIRNRSVTVDVEVSVSKTGQGMVTRLFIDGVEVKN